MSTLRLSGYDATNQFRQISPGDISITGDIYQGPATNGTLTGVQCTSPIIASTSNNSIILFPSAADIISASIGNVFTGQNNRTGLSSGNGVNPGTAWRVQYINNSGAGQTLTNSADGTTVVSSVPLSCVNFALNTSLTLLLTVLNGTPGQAISANTTSGSAVVTGLSDFQTSQLTSGMAVFGTGIPSSTTIASIQPGIGFTISAAATATNSAVGLNCFPRVKVERIA